MKWHNKISFCIYVALLIAFCMTAINCQRGGSRSRSSSSSSRSSRSYGSSYYGSSTRSSKNCTTVDGVTTCTTIQTELSTNQIILLLCGVAGFVGFAIYSSSRDEERRKGIINESFKNYEINSEEFPCSIDDQQKQALIDEFMKKQYTMVINVNDKTQKFYCQVKVVDLKKNSQFKYSIKLSGSDEVGTSKFEGLLIFRGEELGLKLSKVYDDRAKAEQTGKYDILLYEGHGPTSKISGEWAFYGFQDSKQYAGTWVMMEV